MTTTRHEFVWTHAGGTLCEGRFVCEYAEHWELRCSYCGELETALTRDTNCKARAQAEERAP